jgi:hypothetical protein
MPRTIERDIEDLSVNMFVNEYGALRAVYNRLYAIIHVYYDYRRQLAAPENIPPEKIAQMRKDIAARLKRINALTKDEQFPQENFEVFAKGKMEKMHLAVGLLETANLMGEFSSYSKTIIDYMKSCCEFATKFITVLSDPSNQNLKALKENLASLLEQIDMVIQQQVLPPDQGQATVLPNGSLSSREKESPLSAPFSIPQMERVSSLSAEGHLNLAPSYDYVHKTCQSASRESDPISSINEALTILEKIDIFRSKSSSL